MHMILQKYYLPHVHMLMQTAFVGFTYALFAFDLHCTV